MKRDDKDVLALLETLCRLLALNLMQGKNKREQTELLARAGMNRWEIAELVGTTPNTVSVQLSVARKRKKKTEHATSTGDGGPGPGVDSLEVPAS